MRLHPGISIALDGVVIRILELLLAVQNSILPRRILAPAH